MAFQDYYGSSSPTPMNFEIQLWLVENANSIIHVQGNLLQNQPLHIFA